jgi:hypothetical protein
MVEIPLALDVPYFEQETQLDGVTYLLTFRWNDRQEMWFLTVSDIDGDAIVSGLAMVQNWSLLRLVTDERRPPGRLVVFNTENRDPTLTDFGRSAALIYLEEADL